MTKILMLTTEFRLDNGNISMKNLSMSLDSPTYCTGIINKYNFRFLFADCSDPVAEVIKRHNLKYSSAVLVAKSMIGSFFLAGMVKEETIVNIQLEGMGAMQRVMAYSDRYGKMRGLSKFPQIDLFEEKGLGMGKGFFKVSRWGGPQKIQQSITKMEDEIFESSLMRHITESDQQTSFLTIHVDEKNPASNSRGIIFQALPFTTEKQIEEFSGLLGEVDEEASILLSGNVDSAIQKFSTILKTDLSVLETGKTEFYCGCSIDKIKKIIVSLGREEAEEILEEQEQIEMICEFCGEVYRLDSEEVHLLFM
ncbi:MAG: Hsp33 family molecular chaperone HslO [Leptospiraceae bacterium]|nr:Hsp33 family molecular chaperone HslO [Leptospiraceae bacterium]